MPDLNVLVVLVLGIAAVLAITTYRQHHPRPVRVLRYGHCGWCQSEDHAGPYCPRRGEAAQVIPQPRDGHSGMTVPLQTLFAHSRSASRWSR